MAGCLNKLRADLNGAPSVGPYEGGAIFNDH